MGLCPRDWYLSRGGVSVQDGSLSSGSLSRGSLSMGVSVQRGFCNETPGVRQADDTHAPGMFSCICVFLMPIEKDE